MKTALVTGIRGQDGAYLAQFLLEKGYKVYGADRRSGDSAWRLRSLGIADAIEIVPLDVLELTNVTRAIDKVAPDEVYNLAAQSFVHASFEQPILTSEVNGIGVLRLLEAIRSVNPAIRFYQASTSEIFGKVRESPQRESTPPHPRSPYGVSKLFGHSITVNYRESYDLHACSGILFNHESPLRGLEFVTRKITHGFARVHHGLQEKVVLGTLEARRDWGYAKEYVEGMWLMLQQERPDDYVLATGETHSVREFVEHAANACGMDLHWEGDGVAEKGRDGRTGNVVVELSPELRRPAEVEVLVGDASRAKRELGWEPATKFERLVGIMVEADLKLVGESR